MLAVMGSAPKPHERSNGVGEPGGHGPSDGKVSDTTAPDSPTTPAWAMLSPGRLMVVTHQLAAKSRAEWHNCPSP
jgi:hypothetical protein